jgi:hypothetical protein
MVNIRTAPGAGSDIRDEEHSLAQLIQRGNLLPVIAGEALEDLVFGGHDRLVASYAVHVRYPMPDPGKLHKVAKYQSLTTGWKDRKLKEDYLDQVARYLLEVAKQGGADAERLDEALAEASDLTVSQFARRLGYPRLDRGTNDPLLILANLPLPIYLTTSPYTFIEEALRRAGKEPKSELCRWHSGLDSVPSVFAAAVQTAIYQPSRQEPLVYHLFGLDAYPDSLVLTEDDHLDFLTAVSQGRGKDQGVDPVHDVVKGALQSSALLLLGFSLATWAFRALYRGLIKPMPTATLYERFCCVQLAPSEQEKLYLEDYLRKDARFDRVYWEKMESFCQRELRR